MCAACLAGRGGGSARLRALVAGQGEREECVWTCRMSFAIFLTFAAQIAGEMLNAFAAALGRQRGDLPDPIFYRCQLVRCIRPTVGGVGAGQV